MQTETLQYSVKNGWSSSFPDLDSENTLLFVFCASEFFQDQTPIQELARHYPKSKMIGCSTAGEIYGDTVSDHTISVAIVQFEKTQIKLVTHQLVENCHGLLVGEKIVNELMNEQLAGIFLLSEGLKINGSELVQGANKARHDHIVITGGLAADGDQFKKTWVIENGVVHSGCAVGVGFYGKHIRIAHGSKGGWDIFGIERRITRSENNVLYELDGKPALELYKQYLGEKSKDLPASGLLFPLSIRKNPSDTTRLVRTILGIDEEKGALIFAGNMPQGYLVQLMRANFDRLITGAKEAGNMLISKQAPVENKLILVVAISCVGRKLLLGERTEEEVKNVLALFSKGTKMVGFYSYGELSPYASGDCDLHNQTMTLTSFSEE